VKKDQFLSHLSHERRAPLIVIYQFTAIVWDGIARRGLPDCLQPAAHCPA